MPNRADRRPPSWSGSGRAVRAQAEIRNWRCSSCGHQHAHRELQPTIELAYDDQHCVTMIETPHPDYRPGEFHCSAEGCDCRTTG